LRIIKPRRLALWLRHGSCRYATVGMSAGVFISDPAQFGTIDNLPPGE
jgi:hypothetical protein